MAKRYMPATDDVTRPISPARAEARPASPAPVQRPGRGRGHGWWRAQSRETPGVGTRSKTRQAEAAATQAPATRALWPEKLDKSLLITRMTRDLRLQDPPEDRHRIDENQNEVRPPAAGFHSHHRDVFIIPPPRADGPSEYGSAGVNTSLRSSTRDTAPRGPRLSRSSRNTPEGSGHHTQGAHRSCWPTRGPHAMGRSHTLPRWTVIHYMSLPKGTSNPVHSSS